MVRACVQSSLSVCKINKKWDDIKTESLLKAYFDKKLMDI